MTNDYQIESNRRFSLTENNYIASPTTTTTTTTTPTPAIGDNMKENDLYGNSSSGATTSSSTNISISQVSANAGIGLSLPAQQYLKSLPDFSFMLIIPYVENGKE